MSRNGLGIADSRQRIGGEEGDSACRFVEALVAGAAGTSIAALRTGNRGPAAIALARQMAMYLAHVQLGMSLSEVGRRFGRDRTTVAHACARIEDRRDDARFERVLACLEAALERWAADSLASGPVSS